MPPGELFHDDPDLRPAHAGDRRDSRPLGGARARARARPVFQAFRERVERLYAIDAEAVEFDFLRPME